MKPIAAIFIFVLLISCDTTDPSPFPFFRQPALYEETDYKKEYVYNDAWQLVQIRIITEFGNGGQMVSTQDFSYLPDGNVKEVNTDTGFKFVYTYTSGLISRTDEYINGAWTQYHDFTYDNRGRLISTITYQDIPDEGGIIPTSKSTYQYDDNDNLALQRQYYYTSYGAEAILQTAFLYSNYDNKVNTADGFNVNVYNPFTFLRKNNPGKLITQNGSGNVVSTEIYSYQFDDNGYVTSKTTQVTDAQGAADSYVTTFTFKE